MFDILKKYNIVVDFVRYKQVDKIGKEKVYDYVRKSTFNGKKDFEGRPGLVTLIFKIHYFTLLSNTLFSSPTRPHVTVKAILVQGSKRIKSIIITMRGGERNRCEFVRNEYILHQNNAVRKRGNAV